MGCVRANRSKHLSKSTKVTGRGKESETSGRGLSLEQWFSTKEWLGPSVDFGNVWRPFLVVPAVVLVGRRKCHWHLVIEAWDAVAHPRRHNHPAPIVGNAKEVEKPSPTEEFCCPRYSCFSICWEGLPKPTCPTWTQELGIKSRPWNLKSPDLECNVLECARCRVSHWIHFQFLPPTDPAFASAPEETASEPAPMEEWQRPSNTAGLAGSSEHVMGWAHKGPGCRAAVGVWGGWWTGSCLSACLSSFPKEFGYPEGHYHVWDLTQNHEKVQEPMICKRSPPPRPRERVKSRAGWETFALLCHWLYNHKR